MKNRNILIVSFILVACLTIGVGFAALTGSLRADGIVHVNLDDSNLKVQYTAADEEATYNSVAMVEGTDYTVEYASNNTVATITINSNVMKAQDDTVVVKLPIVNNSIDIDAIVKAPTVTMQAGNAGTYLTTDGVKATLNGVADTNVTLKCATNNGGVAEDCYLEVTIILKKVPTDSNITCNFSVAINAESVTVTP